MALPMPMVLPMNNLLGISFFLGAILFAILRIYSRSTRNYPPGPKGLPIIGNLLDVPTSAAWITYFQWSKKYGRLASPILSKRISYRLYRGSHLHGRDGTSYRCYQLPENCH